jgi:hypothetical protein
MARTRLLAILAVLTLVVFATGADKLFGEPVVTAFSPRNSDCVSCHSGIESADTLAPDEGAPDVLVPEGAADSGFWHSRLDCRACHDSRDGQDCPTAGEITKRCVRCHPGLDASGHHPTGEGVYDLVAKGPMSCTSTCHDPHSRQHSFMMRAPYGELGRGRDSLCLKCHKPGSLP